MEWVDGDKNKCNWSENGKYHYNQDEILCCLEPPFPINDRMTMAFSENDQMPIKDAIEKRCTMPDVQCKFCKLF